MQNLFLYIASVFLWGTTWYAIKFQLGDVHPTLSIAYRFLIAAALLYIFCVITGRHKLKFSFKQHGLIAAQGFFLFCFNYWMTYQSTSYLTSGLVALCFSTMTIMNIFGQFLFFRIPFDKKVVIGAFLGLIGMVFVFYPEIDKLSLDDSSMLGVTLCLGGTLSASIGNMLSFRNTRHSMPVILTSTYAMAYGALFTFILALSIQAPLSFEIETGYIVSLLYLAIFGSALAFTFYLTLMAKIGADKAGYVAVLVPVVALLISTIFENYHWNIWSVSGSVLILAGNAIAMINANPFRDLKRPKGWNIWNKN